MIHLKSKETTGVATSSVKPFTSPIFQISLPTSTVTSADVETSNSQHSIPEPDDDSVLDMDDSNPPPDVTEDYRALPTTINLMCSKMDATADHKYFKSSVLLAGDMDAQPSTSMAVKRVCVTDSEIPSKSFRGPQVGQPQDVIDVYA